MIAAFLPSLAQWGILAAVLAALAALAGLGAMVRGADGPRGGDLILGWGVATIVLTLAGLAMPGGLPFVGWLVLVAGWAACLVAWRWRVLLPAPLPWAVLMAVPLVVMTVAMLPSQWDEFSQWLHSLRYLVEHGAFPRRDGAVFEGSFAAYPFANAFPAYLASLVAGGFAENAGILVNLFVCIAFALVLAELLAEAAGAPQAARHPALAALALLLATGANPTFVPKVVFTAYADAPTGLALVLVGLAGWRMLAALERGAERHARGFAVQAGLAGATLLGLKQANLVLFLLALAGLAVVMLRAKDLRRGRSFAHLALVAAPALVPYLAWRWHVGRHFPGEEFVIRPMAQWAIDILPDILARMGSVASNKGGHFGVLAVLLVLGLRGLWRMRGPFDRLAVIAATVALGYNAFLLFAYVTAFSRGEALTAASYWRYNMHVGPIAWATVLFGIATLWRWRVPRPVLWLAPALVVAAPLVTWKHFRFDLHPAKLHLREVGAEMRPLLPQEARVALVDPIDSGFYVLLMKYLLHGRAADTDRYYLNQPPDEARAIAARLDAFQPSHAWVHIPTDAVRQVFGHPLPSGSSHLLVREGGGWHLVRSWPYAGYEHPHALKD